MKKGHGRRWVSVGKRMLCSALALIMSFSALAESAAAAAAQQWEPVPLEAARIENVPDGEYIYFGTAAVTVLEANGAYSVPVYREGDLSGEVTVEVRTSDLTASYGKDYALLLPDTEQAGDGQTILEKYLGDLDSYEAALNQENADYYIITEDAIVDELDGDGGDWYTEVEGTGAGSSSGESASGKSSLAALKEAQTGLETRELYETEYQSLLSAVVDEFVPQVIEQLDYSSTATLTFAPGEAEKTLVFRIKDDGKSEGTETFSIRLHNAEGAEIYQVAALSVAISDDEPLVHSKVSFTKSSYDSENGQVTVTVRRTGAEYSLVDMRLLSSYDTAVAGENYEEVNQLVSFAPYETEKDITLDVYGEGSFSLLLTELTACDAGAYTKTTVNIIPDESGADQPAAFQMTRGSSSDGAVEFTITLDKEYTVRYTPGEHTGKIVDKDYTPEVEVGTYYFSTSTDDGGIFTYGTGGGNYSGDKPNGLGTLECEYVDNDTQHNAYGKVEYYHTYTKRTGRIWSYSKMVMPGVYYQYATPDWESTKSTYGGQAFRFHATALNLDSWATGKFGRQAGNAVVKLKNIGNTTYNRQFDVSVNAVDRETNKTPKSYLRFYGVACMYKQYRVKAGTPAEMSFLTGTGATISAEPVQLYLKCGVQSPELVTTDTTRDIYANPDANKSNVVFSLNHSTVNGMIGKFAELTGYTITIEPGPSDKKTTLEYPADFISYLNSSRGSAGRVADYSSSAIEDEIEKVKDNLGTIPFDAYFIDWIDKNQKAVAETSLGYTQNLTFQPHFKYIDVPVRVLAPAGGVSASFTDSTLDTVGTYTYHAGDILDLSAVCASNGYRITGYEVSTDGGVKWNSIRDTNLLELDPGEVGSSGYYIRPLVEENSNCIEIKFADETAEKFTILGADYGGLVSDELLAAEKMSGSVILRLNDGATATEQMLPEAGSVYSIHIPAFTESTSLLSSTTYYPVITDSYGNTYTTQTLHYTARQNAADNVLTVDWYSVESTPETEYTITGRLVSDYKPIRSTGTETQHLGVGGYTVAMPKGTSDASGSTTVVIDSASAVTDSDGSFTLTGVKGVAGRPMTMLVSNGADTQVVTVTPGNTATLNVGSINLDYPDNAPYVYSLQYTYDKAANQAEADNTQNSVKIYDDTINITIVAVGNGHDIARAEFAVRTVQGIETLYKVPANSANPGVFVCSIPKMTENLNNGDRVTIRLVTEDDSGNEYYYPAVDSGLVFYVENTIQVPLTYETAAVGTNQNSEIEIPLLGAASASAGTGLLSFSRTNWEGGTGYTITANVDAVAFTTSTFSTEEKLAASRKLYSSAKTAHDAKKEAKETGAQINDLTTSAGHIAASLGEENADLKDLTEKYADVANQISMAEEDLKKINEKGKQAKNAVSGYSDAHILKVDVLALLAFDFAYDPEDNAYVLCSGAVSIGGSVNYSKSAYFVVWAVPMYLNITGFLQGDLTVYYPTGNMTAADFEGVGGNIATRMEETSANMTLMLNLKASVGVGMCGVLGGGGAVGFQFQFDIPIVDSDAYGVLIASSGSLFVDALVGRIDIPVFTATMGWGTYEGKTGFDFFGGFASIRSGDSRAVSGGARSGEEPRTVSLRDYDPGTADMSGFGGNGMVRAMPEEVRRTVLLENAGERTAPQIISLDDGKKMIFFIGNRGGEDSLSSRALFWSVCENGAWSMPQILADDGTFDAKPAVLQKNGKVVVAWVDADGTAKDSESVIEQLNSLGISMAIYEDGKWGNEIPLVQNPASNGERYFNFAPQLNLVGDTLYCSYMKRDVNDVTAVDGLLDFTNYYSTMAYVECDVPTRTVNTYEDQNGEEQQERFIVIQHPDIDDPLVMDYQCVTTRVGSDDYMLAAYTVDEDMRLATGEDRELWLSITNLTSGKTYYPLPITDDDFNHAAPKLTDLDGQVYLSWFENGYLFHLMNVSDMLKAFFDSTEAGDVYRNADGEYWYKKSAAELGLAAGEGSDDENDTKLYYDGTFYDLAAQGIFRSEYTNFQASENANTSIAEYTLATNGDDIYIFYTDFGSNNPEELSVELYGVRYQRDMEAEDEKEESWGFGKGVMITDYGKVIDEFDLFMTGDSKISMVSNHYLQSIGSDGTLDQGPNQLVEIEFEPMGSVSIVNNAVDLPSYLVGGSSEFITFDVINDGLLTTTAFDVTVSEVKGGVENVIYQETVETELDCSETYEMRVPWTIPEDLSDTEIKVVVNEKNVSIPGPSTVTVEAPCRASIGIIPSAKWDGQSSYVTATITNNGNQDASSCTVQVCMPGETAKDEVKVYAETTVPALPSGESVEVNIPFTPGVEDFTSAGTIDLTVRVVDGETVLGSGYTRLASVKPIVAEINGGEEALTVSESASLTTVVAPWAGIAGKVRYSSSNPGVADVSEDGTVTAVSSGTATITAYYDGGVSDTIEVNVPGSSGTTSKYRPVVADAEHGSVSVSPTLSEIGERVTITVSPDEGYEVGEVVVTDRNGNALNVTDHGDGTYSFTQPIGRVEIAVTFVPVEEDAGASGDGGANTSGGEDADTPDEEDANAPDGEDSDTSGGEGADLHVFDDVAADAYYADAVRWAVENGITTGTGDGTTFSPDDLCTRAQMATFLWRAAGSPEPAGGNDTFTDVPTDAYYAKAVQWAAENGVTTGTGDGSTFSPDEPCTRAQMVTFLWRAAGSPEPAGSGDKFTDVPADAYYAKAVQWAAENGITTGTGDGSTFSPDEPCTRAQMVTFLWRCRG